MLDDLLASPLQHLYSAGTIAVMAHALLLIHGEDLSSFLLGIVVDS